MATTTDSFRLLPPKVYYVAVSLLVLLIISTFPGRVLHFDDAWNAEQAYWLWQDGYVHSNFFGGAFAAPQAPGEQLFLYHKAFIYAQAPVAGLLGFGVYAVKATALLFALLTLGLLLSYFSRATAEARWLAAFLFLGCGTVLEYCFVNRAETMVMAGGLASFMLLRASRPRPALAGAVAGLAALAHLNGTVYLVAGALWLLWQRAGWPSLLRFAAAGTAVCSLYLLDALMAGQLPRLLAQFTQAPINQGNLHGAQKLRIMLDYPQIFLHSESQICLTLLLVAALLLARPTRRSGQNAALKYLLLLLLGFWVLTARPAAYYFLLFVPFIVIVVVELSLAAAPQWRRPTRLAWVVLLLLYPAGSVVRAAYLWAARPPEPVAARNARLAAYMPRHGSRAVVPLDFFFEQARHYQARSLTYYALLNDAQYGGQLPLRQFFQMLAQDSVQYLVTDHTRNQAFHVPADAPPRIGQYRRVYQTPQNSVYVRQPEPPLPH